MIGTVVRHESASLLRSAQTWLLAAVLAALFGFLFLRQLEGWIAVQAQLALQDHSPGLTGFLAARFLAPLAMLLGFVAPLLAMRAFADELRQGTFALWRSSPVGDATLVLGKYLGVLLVVSGLVLLALAMVASMALFVRVDIGALAAAGLGLALVTAASTAIGLFFSSLTRQPIVAAIGAFALLLPLWLIGGAAAGASPGGPVPAGLLGMARGLGIGERLGGFFQGYVRSDDIVYFVLLAALFLALTVVRLGALAHADAA